MLGYVVMMVLVLAAGFWTLRPLLAPDDGGETGAEPSDARLGRLEKQKQAAYAAIQELAFDMKMGRLAAQDFEALRRQYRREALACIRQIEALQQSNGGAGAGKPARPVREEAGKSQQAAGRGVYCTQCGAQTGPRDRFCFACGAKLGRPSLAVVND